jgi:hypothetical protein
MLACEVGPGRHPAIGGEHVLALFAGAGAEAAAAAMADAVLTARTADELEPELKRLGPDVDFAVLHVVAPFMRAMFRGRTFAFRVVRRDGTVAVFAAPDGPGWATLVEVDAASVEVLDVTAARDDSTLIRPTQSRFGASRVLFRDLADPRPVAAVPPVAMLTFANGAEVAVDATVLVGRSPRAERTTGRLPVLVPLAGADSTVSRTHVRISVDGDVAVLEDLDSTNGTVVVRGGGVRRLEAGDREPLEDGMVVTIAERLAFRVELPR